ncbi:MAG: type II secretion system F family protein, partial [Methanoregulaceae archaeon]|nr:type II secretion system F family protein [Methanoregulaceae archaeon]
MDPNPHISRTLYQVDAEMTPGMFISIWITTTILVTGLAFGISLAIFWLPISPFSTESPWLYVLLLTGVAAVMTGGGFPFYLQNQISNKKMDIERKLPYALSFMSILSSSGATPLDIIRRIGREDYGHISNEFKKVLFRTDVLGEDAVTAMHSLVNNTPSESFRDICIDITNIIYSGGGLKGYLETKSKELMANRRQIYKEFVESLSVYAEGYLGGIIMIITLAVLGIVISGALGIEFGPLTPAQTFDILVYVVTPVVNIIFLAMLGVKYSTTP